MATGTGLDAQVGYIAESAYGTGAAVTRFLPLVSETMKKDINMIESAAIIATRQVMTSQEWALGDAKVGGGIQHELYDQSIGLLLKAAFGTVTEAGTANPYTHTFFPASPVVSFRTQIGRPTVYGSVIPHTYTGCKIGSWEIAGAAGKFFTWGMNIIAQEETAGTALASASYATNLRRWSFRYATLSIDGTVVPVKDFKIGGDNKLAERRFLGSTVISEPLRNDLALYTGAFTCEWGGPSAMGTLAYDRYLQGTESTLIAVMTNGTLSGTVTANVRYDGVTPNVGGRGILDQAIPFKCLSPTGADAAALQIALCNNDSAA